MAIQDRPALHAGYRNASIYKLERAQSRTAAGQPLTRNRDSWANPIAHTLSLYYGTKLPHSPAFVPHASRYMRVRSTRSPSEAPQRHNPTPAPKDRFGGAVPNPSFAHLRVKGPALELSRRKPLRPKATPASDGVICEFGPFPTPSRRSDPPSLQDRPTATPQSAADRSTGVLGRGREGSRGRVGSTGRAPPRSGCGGTGVWTGSERGSD
jgi:hypothetical protein